MYKLFSIEKRMKKLNNKNLQSQETSNRILNQAMKIFLEKGYHGTSIDDITQAAGLTKGALYWHYKSKEDLLKKIVEEFEKRFLDGLIQTLQDVNGGVLDKFEKMLRRNAAFAYYNQELCVSFTTLSAELIGARHEIEDDIKRIYKKYQNFLIDLIDLGKKENVFKKELNSSLTALLVMAFHDGILLQWSMNRKKIDGKAYIETCQKVLLNGLLA